MTTEPRVLPESLQPVPVPGWLDQVRDALTDTAGEGSDGQGSAITDVSFAALHAWHAGPVADLIAETAARHGTDMAPHEAVRALHARAATGEPVDEATWSAALEPALREIYRLAYPRARVHERSASAAASFARSRGWTDAEADRYGETYAALNTEVSDRVHAEANAIANAAAYARAFAAGDPKAYAEAWPYALVRAWVAACAGSADPDGPAAQEARNRLRDGLTDAVRRTSA
ncbi:SpcZ [Streptomyces sp. NPDC090106]|uniref:SpcZ n=1 Tax=Streptomyces sp. NPDC090106 TaxID=3365946 RepID=UPI0038293744